MTNNVCIIPQVPNVSKGLVNARYSRYGHLSWPYVCESSHTNVIQVVSVPLNFSEIKYLRLETTYQYMRGIIVNAM